MVRGRDGNAAGCNSVMTRFDSGAHIQKWREAEVVQRQNAGAPLRKRGLESRLPHQ